MQTQSSTQDPWGLEIQGLGITGVSPQNFRFQNQEKINDFNLNWNFYKYRFEDAQLGRFFQTDPLADQYPHNSTFAFSENKVINHVELEGLEAAPIPYSHPLQPVWEGFGQIIETASYYIGKISAGIKIKTSEIIGEQQMGNVTLSHEISNETDFNASADFGAFYSAAKNTKEGEKIKSNLVNLNVSQEVNDEITLSYDDGKTKLETKLSSNMQKAQLETGLSVQKNGVYLGGKYTTSTDGTKAVQVQAERNVSGNSANVYTKVDSKVKIEIGGAATIKVDNTKYEAGLYFNRQ